MDYDRYEQVQGWHAESFGQCPPEQASYFVRELATCRLDLADVSSALDIGFGNGNFIGWARDHKGWSCVGVEVNSRLLDRARLANFPAWESVAALRSARADARFDLITAFDVLEHIERAHIVPFLQELLAVSGANTRVVLRFPNGDNPFSAPVQNGDVTHCSTIGQNLLRQVAHLAGFEVEMLRSPVPGSLGSGVAGKFKLAAGLCARACIGGVLRHVFMGGQPVLFSTNLLAVLRPATPSGAHD